MPEPEGATVDLRRAAPRTEAVLISNRKLFDRRALGLRRQDEDAERLIACERSLLAARVRAALTVTG
jgi:hypothetical protein